MVLEFMEYDERLLHAPFYSWCCKKSKVIVILVIIDNNQICKTSLTLLKLIIVYEI